MVKPAVQVLSVPDDPVQVGEWRITPLGHQVVVRLPARRFTCLWTWKRPAALIVEHGGQVRRVPIHDVTRWLQLALLLLGSVVFSRAVQPTRRKECEP
jgi:hypothetical protein